MGDHNLMRIDCNLMATCSGLRSISVASGRRTQFAGVIEEEGIGLLFDESVSDCLFSCAQTKPQMMRTGQLAQ